MNVKLSDLIAALPDELAGEIERGPEPSTEELEAIFADLAYRRVPTGGLRRAWGASELSVQIAAAYLALWVRQWFSDAQTRQQRLIDTNLRLALRIFHRMSYLRGAMAKVGQLLGNLPDILPDQVVGTLDRLHSETPPMHFSLLREMVRNELGADPEELFATFEKEAFAAASLGQVHRATLKSGERVAVKIQYPGIARTIDADLHTLTALLFPARLGRGWESMKTHLAEIHRMLTLEADYGHEAESLGLARSLFGPDEGIVIPECYPDYSTRRVLTTAYLPGRHLREFLATRPPARLRNRYGTLMYRAWFRMYYGYINYADPHSGNYLFMDDGRLGLIDFGCVQRYGAEERELVRLTEQLVDRPDTRDELLRKAFGVDEDLRSPEMLELFQEDVDWMLEPVRAEGAFDFGDPDHLRRGVEWLSKLIRTRMRMRHMGGHPMYLYHIRSVYGLKALLLQLGARVNVKTVYEEERDLWRRRAEV